MPFLVGCGNVNNSVENFDDIDNSSDLIMDYEKAIKNLEQVESYSVDASSGLIVNLFDGGADSYITDSKGNYIFDSNNVHIDYNKQPENHVLEAWYQEEQNLQFFIMDGEKYIDEIPYDIFVEVILNPILLKPLNIVEEDVVSSGNKEGKYSFELNNDAAKKFFEDNNAYFNLKLSEDFILESVTFDKYDVEIVDENFKKIDMKLTIIGERNSNKYSIEMNETLDYSNFNNSKVTGFPDPNNFFITNDDKEEVLSNEETTASNGKVNTLLGFKIYLDANDFVESDESNIYTLQLEKFSCTYDFNNSMHYLKYNDSDNIYEYHWGDDTGKVNDCIIDFKNNTYSESCSDEDYTRVTNAKKSFLFDMEFLEVTDYSFLK